MREKAVIWLVVLGKLWYFESCQWKTLICSHPIPSLDQKPAQNCIEIKNPKNSNLQNSYQKIKQGLKI